MALLQSLPLPLGTPFIDFELPATDGRTYSARDFAEKKALVVIFMCNHCPYIKAVIDRLIQIQADYAPQGVQLIGINANDSQNYPEDSFEAMQAWVRAKGINFVYLHDESQQVARAYKAQCTPDIYVFGPSRMLAYHGSADELRKALDALLGGQPAPETQNPSMGCSIKWKS